MDYQEFGEEFWTVVQNRTERVRALARSQVAEAHDALEPEDKQPAHSGEFGEEFWTVVQNRTERVRALARSQVAEAPAVAAPRQPGFALDVQRRALQRSSLPVEGGRIRIRTLTAIVAAVLALGITSLGVILPSSRKASLDASRQILSRELITHAELARQASLVEFLVAAKDRAESGKPIVWVDGSEYALAFSPDGKTIAFGDDDGFVRLWDASTREPVHQLRGGRVDVTAIAFSPDGKTIASGSDEGTVRLWDISTGTSVNVFPSLRGRVNTIAFSPDGKTLTSVGQNGTVVLPSSMRKAPWSGTDHGSEEGRGTGRTDPPTPTPTHQAIGPLRRSEGPVSGPTPA
jgi:hypothetical protein